jgi:hypothetical protein
MQAAVNYITVNMEQQLYYSDREEPNNSEKNLAQSHFFEHKYNRGFPGQERRPPWPEAGD